MVRSPPTGACGPRPIVTRDRNRRRESAPPYPVGTRFSNAFDYFTQSFFGFGQSADIEITLDGAETRKTADIKSEDGKKERHLLYYDGETVSGKVKSSSRNVDSIVDARKEQIDRPEMLTHLHAMCSVCHACLFNGT